METSLANKPNGVAEAGQSPNQNKALKRPSSSALVGWVSALFVAGIGFYSWNQATTPGLQSLIVLSSLALIVFVAVSFFRWRLTQKKIRQSDR